MKSFLIQSILLIIMISGINVNAQTNKTVFVHKEVRNAIDNNTRTNTGVVGDNYWQNYCNYDIKAEIFTDTKLIKGTEVLTYFNNSPDTLRRLYFSNVQDLFKKGIKRDWDMGTQDLHDGVQIHSIEIDGVNFEMINNKTVFSSTTDFIVILKSHFAPKTTHKIKIEWTNIIPKYTTVRNGIYGETNYMLGYWFPKMKVYDDMYGWAKIPHTGMAEFYNEFGNYNVEITTPKDYKLWSTGVLQNPEHLYTKTILKRIEEAKKSDEVVNIITKKDVEKKEVLKNKTKNLWILKMDSVTDFAFAISKDYLWDATSIQLKTKRVNVNAVYKSDSKDFAEIAEITRNVIDFFSNTNPGIEYPFPQMTAFNGGGGMEYPAMVNDGDNADLEGTLYLTAHEVGHSYFPFNTGLNEQRYAWMDEGLITYFPRKFVKKYVDDKGFTAHRRLVKQYNKVATTEKEIPLMVPSFNTGIAYRYQAYNKSSVAFHVLCNYLGEDVFNKALQVFSANWVHKHPTGYDFFNTFNTVSGENLSWFWNPWFFGMQNADLAIGELNDGKLNIVNNGGLPVAVLLTIYSGEEYKKLRFKANVWKDSDALLVDIPEGFKLTKAELNTLDMPDVNHDDNVKEF